VRGRGLIRSNFRFCQFKAVPSPEYVAHILISLYVKIQTQLGTKMLLLTAPLAKHNRLVLLGS
jgi:hypothetical protein